jgi:hypothetical protein
LAVSVPSLGPLGSRAHQLEPECSSRGRSSDDVNRRRRCAVAL